MARRVRDRAAVDDIVQDVFLKLHAARASIRSIERIGGWLGRVAANAIADHFRAQRRTEPLLCETPADSTRRDLGVELAACLRPIVEALPPAYRDAVRWSELDGIPQREVAVRLGLSLPGAKSRVQRGRSLLRQRLLACYDIEHEDGGIVECRCRNPARCC